MACMVYLLILLAQVSTAASLKVNQKAPTNTHLLPNSIDHSDKITKHANVSKHTHSSHDGGTNEADTSGVLIINTQSVHLTLATEMPNPWINAVPCYESNLDQCSCGPWDRWQYEGTAPAGCAKNTLASIYALAKFVHSFGYTLELSGGTLLGAMRCGAFIPWDYDGDLGVITNAGSPQEARQLAGLINIWAGGPQKPPSVYVTVDGGHGVTHWEGSDPAGTTNGNVHLGIYINDKPKRKLIPCVLNDIVLYCPATYNEELTSAYGADWKSTPKRWKSWQNSTLTNPIRADIASLHACEHRMTLINEALAKMQL